MQWTTEQIDFAKERRAFGLTGREIAEELQERFERRSTPAGVLLLLKRHDQEARSQQMANRAAAYGARRAVMRKLAWDGLACSEIARVTGEKISSVEWAVPESLRGQSWVDKRFSPQTEFDSWLKGQRGYRRYVEPPITHAGKLFLDKRESECSWWLGDDCDGKQRFCCEPRESRRSYCAAHHAASIAPQLDVVAA